MKGSNDLDFYIDSTLWRDPEVLSVADKLRAHVVEDEARPQAAQVEIRLRDGRRLEGAQDDARGTELFPFGDDVIESKFRRLAASLPPVTACLGVSLAGNPAARLQARLLQVDGDGLVLKRYWSIGFAADTPQGLVVPVIRDADRKGVIEIAREMGELAKLAREGKLAPAQMQGGCFTISSLGGIGGIYFTPIINAPEVAILGVCRSYWKQVSNDGKTSAWRYMLPLSLSWDHRVIDGAAAARFNAHFAALLGDLRRVLM